MTRAPYVLGHCLRAGGICVPGDRVLQVVPAQLPSRICLA